MTRSVDGTYADPHTAELAVAVAVADAWHRRGVGRRLVDVLADLVG